MFVACILIYQMVKGWWNKAEDKLNGNLANPFQTETTEQIRKKEAAVKATTYRSSNLRHKNIDYYQQLADSQFEEMTSSYNIDEDKLIAQLKPLNTDELRAVYKCFGVKDANVLGTVAAWTQDIFGWYNHLLSDTVLGGKDLTAMRAVWAKTGLWPAF